MLYRNTLLTIEIHVHDMAKTDFISSRRTRNGNSDVLYSRRSIKWYPKTQARVHGGGGCPRRHFRFNFVDTHFVFPSVLVYSAHLLLQQCRNWYLIVYFTWPRLRCRVFAVSFSDVHIKVIAATPCRFDTHSVLMTREETSFRGGSYTNVVQKQLWTRTTETV